MNGNAGSMRAPTTALERLAAYGATAALVSGVVAALGSVFLFANFAAQASTLSEVPAEMSALDRIANGLIGLAMLVAIPIAFRLHEGWRAQAAGANTAALVIGVVSFVGYGLAVLVLAAGIFEQGDVGSVSVVPLGGIGLWFVLVSVGAADAAFSSSVIRWLGVAIGLGLLFLPIGFFLGGGSAAAANPKLAFESPLLIVTAVLSLIAAQIGYPIWAIWLNRRWRGGG